MKVVTRLLLLTALFISFTYVQAFAQREAGDSLYVYAFPEGNLNTVINGDTTATGVHKHKYYVLQQTGSIDTTYYLTEDLRVKDLTLIGKDNPVTGFPPVVSVAILPDNSSPGQIAVAIDKGFVHFENLYLIGTRFDGSEVTGQAVSAGDSCTMRMDHCIFENFGRTSTPNVLNTWNATGVNIFVNNCEFRDCQSNVPQNPGMNWAGPGEVSCDSVVVKNSTFFVFGGAVTGSGSSVGYLDVDHCTFFMQTKTSPFCLRQMTNANITNNIFFSCYSSGLDSTTINNPDAWNANIFSPPAVLTMDSLYSDLTGDPFNLTEADRKVVATNNAYFWPTKIMDNFNYMNSDTATYWGVGGKIIAPVWVSARIGAEAILNLSNLKIAANLNYNVDPGFNSSLVDMASDSMVNFVRVLWSNNNDGTGASNFVYSHPSNYSIYANVASDWKTKQGYPVQENLSYTNATLKTAGTDGKPLGDLNWFPNITAVKKAPNSVPTRFDLSQNYPNPFNPSTEIKYNIPKSSMVTLKVYNMLGQEVATLVNKEQTAGSYSVNFNASNLASGVYLYKLQSGSFTITKKMMLLK